MEYRYQYKSPIGSMTLSSDGDALTGLWFDSQKHIRNTQDGNFGEKNRLFFEEAIRWLDCYFRGEIPDFVPKLKLEGTEFRKKVWNILLTIPYGQTMTYGGIAERFAGQNGITKMSAQAVGGAVGHNPVGIIVPCHRVIGADRSLTGYAGGLEKKARLLQIEQIPYKEQE